MFHQYHMQNLEPKIEHLEQQYKIVFLCVLINLNILYEMRHHSNNVDGELKTYILIMKLYQNNLVMYYVHSILKMIL
jgi:hypothetical protein